MKKLIENFSNQLVKALEIGKSANIKFNQTDFTQVLVSGLGGSGIGASIVQEYVFDKLNIPFSVNKDYFIPKSVNSKTLFIACSYSGNTEETLQAVELAKKSKASIVCVTSGGKLLDFAKKHNYPSIEIPSGMPPRSCLGYSLVQLLYILKSAKLLKAAFEVEINTGIARINKETKSIQKSAMSLATKLVNKHVAIYSIAGKESLATRFRQQLNENSKVLGHITK
jgi:glucose/mannose-6-phosphate isomerase